MSDIDRRDLDHWLSSIKLEYASRQVGPKILRFLVRWDTMYEVTNIAPGRHGSTQQSPPARC